MRFRENAKYEITRKFETSRRPKNWRHQGDQRILNIEETKQFETSRGPQNTRHRENQRIRDIKETK